MNNEHAEQLKYRSQEKNGDTVETDLDSLLSRCAIKDPVAVVPRFEPGTLIRAWVGELATDGRPTVQFGTARTPIAVSSIVAITSDDTGREIALSFIDGDPEKPLIIGFMLDAVQQNSATTDLSASEKQIKGRKLVFTGEEQVMFKCGKASITLTREGKIITRGAYLSSSSSGVNKIFGASVRIN